MDLANGHRLGVVDPAGRARRHRAGPGDAGMAAGASVDPGALRLCLDRAGGPVRLPLVPRGAIMDGMARPAPGDRLGPLYPSSRTRARRPARHGRLAVTP